MLCNERSTQKYVSTQRNVVLNHPPYWRKCFTTLQQLTFWHSTKQRPSLCTVNQRRMSAAIGIHVDRIFTCAPIDNDTNYATTLFSTRFAVGEQERTPSSTK